MKSHKSYRVSPFDLQVMLLPKGGGGKKQLFQTNRQRTSRTTTLWENSPSNAVYSFKNEKGTDGAPRPPPLCSILSKTALNNHRA